MEEYNGDDDHLRHTDNLAYQFMADLLAYAARQKAGGGAPAAL